MTAPAMTAERALAVLERVIERSGHIVASDVVEARAFFAAMVERTTWRPIETAPKEVPVLVGPSKRMGICVAKVNGEADYVSWETETPSDWVGIYPPKYWMHLPADPEPQP